MRVLANLLLEALSVYSAECALLATYSYWYMTLYTVILCTSIQAYAFIFNHYVYDIFKSDSVIYIPVLYQLPAALNVRLSLSDLCIRLYVQTST